MKTSDIYLASIKIFGLYLIYRFIDSAFTFGYLVYSELLNTDSIGVGNMGYLVMSISYLALGFFLIKKTKNIVRLVDSNERSINIDLSKYVTLEVGISIFALVLITMSICWLMSYFIESTYFHDHSKSEYLNHDRTRYIAQKVVELVAGIFLLFNTRNFASIIINRNEKKTL